MTRVIAHRGASAAAPENTIEAFTLARSMGADWVELDARRTKDDQIVVHHDAHLGDGRAIVDLNRSELPAEVCDLEAALEACAGMSVNIEVKNWPGDVDFDTDDRVGRAVVELVEKRALHSRVLVSCFHQPTLDLIVALDSSVPTAMLGLGPPGGSEWSAWCGALAEAGHRAVHPWFPVIEPDVVAVIHEAGLEVNVWTVNETEDMRRLVAAGVDGLCTDHPDRARRVVDGDLDPPG